MQIATTISQNTTASMNPGLVTMAITSNGMARPRRAWSGRADDIETRGAVRTRPSPFVAGKAFVGNGMLPVAVSQRCRGGAGAVAGVVGAGGASGAGGAAARLPCGIIGCVVRVVGRAGPVVGRGDDPEGEQTGQSRAALTRPQYMQWFTMGPRHRCDGQGVRLDGE